MRDLSVLRRDLFHKIRSQYIIQKLYTFSEKYAIAALFLLWVLIIFVYDYIISSNYHLPILIWAYDDNARYILSALSQAQAAIFGIFFTLIFISTQLQVQNKAASPYNMRQQLKSIRLYCIFLLFIISITSDLVLLRQIPDNKYIGINIFGALALAVICILLLLTYMRTVVLNIFNNSLIEEIRSGNARYNLSGADLFRAKLPNAELAGRNLTKAKMRWAYLSEANLIGANLFEADLSGAILSEANLHGTYLIKTDLSGALLNKADLSDSDLSNANLNDVCLTEANLSGVSLLWVNRRQEDPSLEVNLSGADLRKANLSRALLVKANLRRADLRGANLSEANLSGADLREADLRGADLSETVLNGSNLAGAKFDDS